jgi:hypothetical protein
VGVLTLAVCASQVVLGTVRPAELFGQNAGEPGVEDLLAETVAPTMDAAPTATPAPPAAPASTEVPLHLTAKPEVKGLSADEQARLQAVAVLNVREVHFEQGSAALSRGFRPGPG